MLNRTLKYSEIKWLCLINRKTISFVTPYDLDKSYVPNYQPSTHARVSALSLSISLSLYACLSPPPSPFSPPALSPSPSFHSKSNFYCNESLRITHLTGVVCYHKHCSLGRYLFNSLLDKPAIQFTSTN